jgi:hypothetical protein
VEQDLADKYGVNIKVQRFDYAPPLEFMRAAQQELPNDILIL